MRPAGEGEPTVGGTEQRAFWAEGAAGAKAPGAVRRPGFGGTARKACAWRGQSQEEVQPGRFWMDRGVQGREVASLGRQQWGGVERH